MNTTNDFEYLKYVYDKEDLHSVFGTVLDLYPSVKKPYVSGEIMLFELLQNIRYNLNVDLWLTNKYVNGVKNKAYDELKKNLEAVCYNATFNDYKKLENLKSITNLMFLDIDGFKTKAEAEDYKGYISLKYQWIVSCCLSPSKRGLHIIIMVDNIIDNNDYNQKYDFISTEYFDGKLDKGAKSLARFSIISSDFKIYINEKPAILTIDQIYVEYKKGLSSTYIKDNGFSNNPIKEKGLSSAYRDNESSTDNKKGKGIRSAYIQGSHSFYNHFDEKGLSSVYIDNESSMGNGCEKGIRSVHNEEKKIICTPCTFSNSDLNGLMNDAALNNKLRFRQEVDESLFENPNVPIYVPNGIDVIEVNLFPLRGNKIPDGHRNKFIGALTVKMIYLNAGSPDNNDLGIRRDILKFILYINRTVCDPPLTYDEVIKSYNANWKRYKNREINFNKYYIKKRAFWSKQSTLTANEKRIVTCKIKNKPIVQETKSKIYEGIEQLMSADKKITQKEVSNVTGLGLSTIKKYWKDFKDMVKVNNLNQPLKETVASEPSESKTKTEDYSNENQSISADVSLIYDDLEIKGSGGNEDQVYTADMLLDKEITVEITHEQIHTVFKRVFKTSIPKLTENEIAELFERFVEQFNTLPSEDKQLLVTPLDEMDDSDTYFRQSSLDSKLWNLRLEDKIHPKKIPCNTA